MSDLEERARKLYRPPFRYEMGYVLDADGEISADVDKVVKASIALRVRGWGRMTYMPEPHALQDEVGRLMALALTEFWTKHQGG